MTAETRRAASNLAVRSGFSEAAAGEVAIAVTEVCTNILKHAGEGTVLVSPSSEGGVDLLALDKGPGIRNLDACLADGYSTAGTSGTGLGAMRRFARRFDIYSLPGKGTVLHARFGGLPSEAEGPDIFGIRTTHPGEQVCGDNFGWRTAAGRQLLIVADGLGHGTAAAAVSSEALTAFHSSPSDQPALLVQDIHAALRSTRGAAVAVARLDLARKEVLYAGLGNISGAVVTQTVVRHMVSHNGTAGHHAQRIADFTYPWTDEAALIMCSDGLTTHWSVQPYPGLLRHSSPVIAAVLYRDYLRGRDDATVLVARAGQRSGGTVAHG